MTKKAVDLKDLSPVYHGTTKLGERGQVVIPKSVREQLGLKKGDNFLIMEKHGTIILASPGMLQDMVDKLTEGLSKLKKK